MNRLRQFRNRIQKGEEPALSDSTSMSIRKEFEAYAKSKGIAVLDSEEKQKRIEEGISMIASIGIYPKEAAELLRAYLEEYNGREVYDDSPRLPQMDQFLEWIRTRAKADRSTQVTQVTD